VPLLWQMPQAIIMEMVLTGDWMPIERVHDMGWINYLEDTPEAVQAKARQLAERIRDNAPLSVMAGKAALIKAISLGCEAGLAEANACTSRCMPVKTPLKGRELSPRSACRYGGDAESGLQSQVQ
jgi:enoyl-CoA hydratase/carnithine racemase